MKKQHLYLCQPNVRTEMTGTEGFRLNIEQAIELLDNLCNDEPFRQAFSKDPAFALAEMGIEIPKGKQPFCFMPSELADREELRQAHSQLLDYLASRVAMDNPMIFEKGSVLSAFELPSSHDHATTLSVANFPIQQDGSELPNVELH